jgi:hypothetical protein
MELTTRIILVIRHYKQIKKIFYLKIRMITKTMVLKILMKMITYHMALGVIKLVELILTFTLVHTGGHIILIIMAVILLVDTPRSGDTCIIHGIFLTSTLTTHIMVAQDFLTFTTILTDLIIGTV